MCGVNVASTNSVKVKGHASVHSQTIPEIIQSSFLFVCYF